jgi:hypothetical protein
MIFSDLPSPAEAASRSRETDFHPRIKSKGRLFRHPALAFLTGHRPYLKSRPIRTFGRYIDFADISIGADADNTADTGA